MLVTNFWKRYQKLSDVIIDLINMIIYIAPVLEQNTN